MHRAFLKRAFITFPNSLFHEEKLLSFFVFAGITEAALACPLCNRDIRNGIYNSQFYPNLFTMLLAFLVLAVIVILLSVISTKRHHAWQTANPQTEVASPVPLITAAMVLGIGLGGFADGIVLHQTLQVHEMLSNKIPDTDYIGKSVNMFWDGIFHLFCFLVVITGIVLLWKLLKRNDINPSGRLFTAGLISGWGIFNIVEGIIDHQILKLHNVIERSPHHDMGNFIFLIVSFLMLLLGWLLVRSEYKKRYPDR